MNSDKIVKFPSNIKAINCEINEIIALTEAREKPFDQAVSDYMLEYVFTNDYMYYKWAVQLSYIEIGYI